MKLERREKGALGIAVLAAAVTLASATLTVKRRRLLPAVLAVGSAYLTVGAVGLLDGAYRAELAADAGDGDEELFDDEGCSEAEQHVTEITHA